MSDANRNTDEREAVSAAKIVEYCSCAIGLVISLLVVFKLVLLLFLVPETKVDVSHLASLLILGLAALLWPTIAKFKTPFGEIERITQAARKEIKETVEQSKSDIAATVSEAQVVTAVAVSTGHNPLDDAEKKLGPVTVKNDPQKTRFGNANRVGTKELTASVEAMPGALYTINVLLKDSALAPGSSSIVRFFLHDTFPNSPKDIVMRNGEARFRLIAYGSFTIGAICADGTLLELDLADPALVLQPDAKFMHI